MTEPSVADIAEHIASFESDLPRWPVIRTGERPPIPRSHYAPTLAEIRRELAGKDLACWCPLVDTQGNRVPCHADVLLEIANGSQP